MLKRTTDNLFVLEAISKIQWNIEIKLIYIQLLVMWLCVAFHLYTSILNQAVTKLREFWLKFGTHIVKHSYSMIQNTVVTFLKKMGKCIIISSFSVEDIVNLSVIGQNGT